MLKLFLPLFMCQPWEPHQQNFLTLICYISEPLSFSEWWNYMCQNKLFYVIESNWDWRTLWRQPPHNHLIYKVLCTIIEILLSCDVSLTTIWRKLVGLDEQVDGQHLKKSGVVETSTCPSRSNLKISDICILNHISIEYCNVVIKHPKGCSKPL